MLRGSNVAVILYCLGFHIFRLFHAMNCNVASCQILLFQFNAVKFSWTVATALFIVLHNSFMLMQSSEALPFDEIFLLTLQVICHSKCAFVHIP